MKGGCTVVTEESKQIILTEEDIQEALKYIMEKTDMRMWTRSKLFW